MIRILIVASCVFTLGRFASGAELDVRLELPSMQLVLEPASPPLLQREGTSLISEQSLIRDELAPLIDTGDYEGALSVLRDRRDWLATLLETGESKEDLRRRAVPGGLNFGVGSGLVSTQLLFLAGHIYFVLEQYSPAETAFLGALAVLPDYVRVHEALGLLYMRLERYDEARDHLARAASLGLNTPNLYGALGYINHQTNNYWGSASAFQQALVMEPESTNFQRGLLHALSETGQFRSGRALVEQMLQQSPDDPDLWVYRSHLSLLGDRRPEALASLEAAIRLGDESITNMQAVATLHMELGSIARAVDLLRLAYSQGMEYRFLDQALAWLIQKDEWVDVDELLTAVEAQRDALTLPEQSRMLTRRASFHAYNGNSDEATSGLEDAVDIDPLNADALMALALQYVEVSDYNRAELLFQRASSFDAHRDNALVSMAQIAIDREDFERALQLLRDVLSGNPLRTDLQRNIDSLENLVLLRTAN
jgi:tetratricopeptide (TPR) repeat protein